MTTITCFYEKVSILTKLIAGQTFDIVAEAFGTTIDQVEAISKNRLKIMEVCHLDRQTQHMACRGGHYPRTEKLLFCWLGQQNTNVTNRELAEKAKDIITVLNEKATSRSAPVFSGSRNWANSFKSRYGIERPKAHNSNDQFKAEPESLQSQDIPAAKVFEAAIKTESVSSSSITIKSEESLPNNGVEGQDQDHSAEFIECAADDENDETSGSRDVDETSGDETATNDGWEKWEELPSTSKLRKRKRSVIADNASSDSECEPLSKNGKFSIKVLVPSGKHGIKSMSLIEYMEERVIRVFKPVLKFARDNGWCDEDTDHLHRLYRKSLKRCGGNHKQAVITEFFKKVK